MEPSIGNWPSGPTGCFFVTLRDGPVAKSRVLHDSAGLRTASSMDLPSGAEIQMLGALNGVVYENVGMATPHVSGCAALWAQATGLRGRELWEQLRVSARPIGLPTQHGGAGLVQAPQF